MFFYLAAPFHLRKEVQGERKNVALYGQGPKQGSIRRQKLSVVGANRNVANAFPLLLSFVLKKKAAGSSETLVAMRHHTWC